MRAARPVAAGLLAAAVALTPALAPAQGTQRPRIAIAPRAVTFGERAMVDARLVEGRDDSGTPVALLERRLPGDGRYREIHRTRAGADGVVRFEIQPRVNAYYAVRTRSEPVQTSLGLLVRVRPAIAVFASAVEVPRREPVTLTGTIAPAVDGTEVTAQRRGERRWRTVATTTARAGTQSATSAFELTFRARRSGRYRVVVAATDALSQSASTALRLRVTRRSTG